MSAQGGIWNFDGRPVNLELLTNLSKRLKQYGPDGEFSWHDNSIAMLSFLYHTTAESRREKQPFVSRRGFVLTWDGRLDNRDELIADLGGRVEGLPSDIEILATAFDFWEEDCFRRLVGDWAACIWKPTERELIFAVDFMAIRHLYYGFQKESIWWSTDITPLVQFTLQKLHIDEEYIAGYFSHEADAHVTPYREIRQVPPGHFVRNRFDGTTTERYWRFRPKFRIRHNHDAEYEEQFRYLFRQSVRRRLRTDSPILAELSGGLDSSSIVCVADDILAKEGAPTPRIDTLSYYDKTEPDGDDYVYFPKVEEKRGKTGFHIDVSKVGHSPAKLERHIFAALPGSLGLGRQLNAERVAILSNCGYRVVLSGIGGDEFMGGIPNPFPQLADLLVQFKLVTLAKQLSTWSHIKRRPWVHLLGQTLMEVAPSSFSKHFLKQARVESWIERGFARRAGLANRRVDAGEHFGFWLPSRRAAAGTVVLMGNKMAKCESSSLGLEEARYPYLDQTLLEFILAVPASQLLRPRDRRSLMRRALAGIVPLEILSRRTKQFGARTHMLALTEKCDELLGLFAAPISAKRGYINRSRLIETLLAWRSGKIVHVRRFMRTISLEIWLADLASRGLIW